MKTSEMVKEYYETAGIRPDPETCVTLVVEEFNEWCVELDAMFLCEHNQYLPQEELKELADLLYVVYGYALSRGWDLDEAVRRIHENNLARQRQDDGTIKRNESGKIIKNPNTKKVDLSGLV